MAENEGQHAQPEQVESLPSLVSIAKTTAGYCLQHPALMLTLGYVYVSAIGMAYTSALFSNFGMNVLEFAEANDFLLAAFRQPVALVLSVVYAAIWGGYILFAYAIMVLPERILAWVARPVWRLPEPFTRFVTFVLGVWRIVVSRFFPLFFALAIALALLAWSDWSLTSLSNAAGSEAQRIASGASALLVVELVSSDAEGPSAIIEDNVWLIGIVGSFAFFYDHNQQCTLVIPTANIRRVYTVPPE